MLPREAPSTGSVDAAEALPVRSTEVAAWTGTLELPAGFIALVAGVAAVLVVLGLTLLLTLGPRTLQILLSPALLFVVLPATTQFVVIAGAGRLRRPVRDRLAPALRPPRRSRERQHRRGRPRGRLRRVGPAMG